MFVNVDILVTSIKLCATFTILSWSKANKCNVKHDMNFI